MTGMPDAAGRTLRLDPATRDARFRGVGSDRPGDLAAASKHATIEALERTITGGTRAAIRAGTRTAAR